MLGVLIGFAVIAVIVLAGYFVERIELLPVGTQRSLNLFSFYVAAPALLFVVIGEMQVRQLFSPFLVTAFAAFAVGFAVFLLLARIFARRDAATTLLGAMSASMVNSNNMGLPVAVYVLGSAAYVAPVLLMQLIVVTPLALAALDIVVRGRASWRDMLLQPIRSPIIIASLLGFLCSLFELELPDPVLEPFRLLGSAAIPVILFAFGMSLRGHRPLAVAEERAPVLLATGVKLLVVPMAAWLVGALVFGMRGQELFAAVVMAALPSAQNVWNYAVRFQRAERQVRDTVLLTSLLALPVTLLGAWLLA